MRAPSVVALGGGHGLAVTLNAVTRYAGQVTAVVSVADDGGSSGRLRAFWPGPAPGDVRRCLLSLAADGPLEKLWAQVLDYRFTAGELVGHSLGNLVLMALSEVTGDFAMATAELGRLLGVTARVLPATLGAVDLCAEMETPQGRAEVTGQAKVTHSPAPVRRVWLSPSSPDAPAEVLAAIAGADQVVLGPGSLFTSVLAVCAVPAIRRALEERAGGRVYVCNLAPQEGETAGFDADAHLEALAAHNVPVDIVVCDPSTRVGVPAGRVGLQSGAGGASRSALGARVVIGALAGPDGHSHNPAFLAEVLEALARTA
ncbi:MAG: gluconeogenesis factor YvcK family protein [Acidimicrobiales bacterium]